MAYGLPVEGEEGPFAGDELVETTTCGPDDRAEKVLSRLVDREADQAVVVNEQGAVLGLVTRAELEHSTPSAGAASVMTLSPTTVRPSVLLSSLDAHDSLVIVTDSAGTLLGVVEPRPESDPPPSTEMDQLQSTFLEVAHAVEEHFDGGDPSEEEVRAFLQERLVAEGRTAEEAEAYLSAMDQGGE